MGVRCREKARGSAVSKLAIDEGVVVQLRGGEGTRFRSINHSKKSGADREFDVLGRGNYSFGSLWRGEKQENR